MSSIMRIFLYDERYTSFVPDMQGRMATAYAELLEALWSNRYYSISPVQFQDEFISLRPQFERRVEQDAQVGS